MKTRVLLTVLVVLGYIVGTSMYDMMQGPIEASAAVGQLGDGAVQYGASRAVAMGLIPKLAFGALLLILGVLWLPVVFRRNGARNTTSLVLIAAASIVLAGCRGPFQVEVVEEIAPNETAFLVPFEGNTQADQGKFMSIEYLNNAKVATKRVTIPTRKRTLGRGWSNYEWIPTVKLIAVNRTPVTRVWTQSAGTGTNPSNEAFCVESQESVDFCAGATAIATITEDDAAKYQYNYSGKPLATVMDEDVRGYAGTVLSREFGNRSLDLGRKNKAVIFTIALTETREFFATKGVTLLQFGSSEGLQYTDARVQTAINDTFVAENDKNTATNEKLAQQERNLLNVAKATADRQAAQEFAKALEAQSAKIELDIERIKAEAMLEAAKRWKGDMPSSILPQGSNLLFGLDRQTQQK